MSWLRANRFWLPALPLALAALAAASSYNLKPFWYDDGLHHVMARAEPDRFVTVTDPFVDAQGATSRTFRVRAASLESSTLMPSVDDSDGIAPPEGGQGLIVHLDFEADPDQTLVLCRVALLDDDGHRYEIAPDSGQGDLCVPDGHEGPQLALGPRDQRGQVAPGAQRPPAWSTAPVFLVPDGVRIERVLVWWDFPDYVELPVP